jgi:NIMA-interacting peptidyl-prolyl cis-trans isomerase 1
MTPLLRWTTLLIALSLPACDGSEAPGAPSASSPPSARPPPGATTAPDATATAAAATSAAAVDPTPPAQIAAQHVLVAYKGAKSAPKEVTRTKEEAKALAGEVRDKAKGGADFAELAKAHSDDLGSKERLGSLGTFRPEEMVEPFSKAAFALPVGGVSDVVETPFGFHVIKRNQ